MTRMVNRAFCVAGCLILLFNGGSACDVLPVPPDATLAELLDGLAGEDPVSTFDGEWASGGHQFALRITNRAGVVTQSNSDARRVGDLMLVILSADESGFNGRWLFMDGTVHDVYAAFTGEDTLAMAGAAWAWTLQRLDAGDQPDGDDDTSDGTDDSSTDGDDQADPFPVAMAAVAGGGAGPAYAFEIGQFEITNAQWAGFLNDAELDGGATGRGSSLVFTGEGAVQLENGEVIYEPQALNRDVSITYDPTATLGQRYRVDSGMEKYPAVEMDYFACAKFCNWLTLREALDQAERAYTEGAEPKDWHPATISTEDWLTRDLNATERQQLVQEYRGFRLPMAEPDDRETSQVGAFNEWYKAAAYDPAAPDVTRTGPDGFDVPADHWVYGFGRDEIATTDANFAGSGDPFDKQAPVGFFDGVNLLADGITATSDTNNLYGLYDMSGNVWERVEEGSIATEKSEIRGGSLNEGIDRQTAAYDRESRRNDGGHSILGLRVVRVPG